MFFSHTAESLGIGHVTEDGQLLLLRPPLLNFFVFVRLVIAGNRYLYAYLSFPKFLTVLELVRELLSTWSRTIRALFLVNDRVVDRGMEVMSLHVNAIGLPQQPQQKMYPQAGRGICLNSKKSMLRNSSSKATRSNTR